MKNQTRNQQPRATRVVFVLLVVFVLIAAACGGGESATETSGTVSPVASSTSVAAANVEADGDEAGSDGGGNPTTSVEVGEDKHVDDFDQEGDLAADEAEVESAIVDQLEEGGSNNDVVPTTTTVQVTGDEQVTTDTTPTTTAPTVNIPNGFSVEKNIGPDGVTYNRDHLEIIETSRTIREHRWGSNYFFARQTGTTGRSYDDAYVFLGIREPLDEVFYVDYTPQPNAERRDAEGRVWVNQWLDSTIPIVDNLDLRIRNTITGEVEHWRVFGWEERGAPGWTDGEPAIVGEAYYEAIPETQLDDILWGRQFYSCHYATDGVEFPPGEARAWVRVAEEIQTERGSWEPSGDAWVTFNNNHSGWQGFC